MGVHVVELLQNKGYNCWVTSRSSRKDTDKIHYLKGTPLDNDFLTHVMKMREWDSVIDFMYYDTVQFKFVVDVLLSNTKQYIFISSARVYSNSNSIITEETPRLLDVCTDKKYIESDEYAIAKAREEDILIKSGRKNWVIVRPYITFGEKKFQLSPIQKEYWLYRAIKGKKILFAKDLAEKTTTFTYGLDVAKGIAALSCAYEANGESFHITSSRTYTWAEILDIYLEVLEKHLGHRPTVHYIDKWKPLLTGTRDQVYYDRLYNRIFDNKKINHFVDTNSFAELDVALKGCLDEFLKNLPDIHIENGAIEGAMDRESGEWESIQDLCRRTPKDIIRYFVYRLGIRQ